MRSGKNNVSAHKRLCAAANRATAVSIGHSVSCLGRPGDEAAVRGTGEIRGFRVRRIAGTEFFRGETGYEKRLFVRNFESFCLFCTIFRPEVLAEAFRIEPADGIFDI